MTLTLDTAYYEDRIKSCENNLKAVEEGPYTPEEKELLTRIYKGTLRRYKRELMSFYPEHQN